MAVDPVTNAITVDRVGYGSYDFGPPIGSVNFFATSVEGEADPCDHSFHVLLNHEAEGFGDQGNYLIVLKKL
jgi:hypothetical protein